MSQKEPTLLQRIGNLDPVIHIPARLMIIKALSELDRVDCVKLSGLTGLSWGNLSSHLSKLEASAYISIEKSWIGKKPNTSVQLTPKGKHAYEAWAQTVLCAMPAWMNPELLFEPRQAEQKDSLTAPQPKLPELPGSAKVLWFLPSYHRWDISLPPIDSLNQQYS